MTTITKYENDHWRNAYAKRIMEVCGWSETDAVQATEAIDEKMFSEYIADGVTGSEAADDEIECWSNDE